ncbi:MAG: hypothetical protein IKI04_00200, partial [Bacilli bacterium]|nr:hypothetical protein [Bacilli bacterium]
MKNKTKKILIIVAIAFIGISIVGSTYAYLTMSLNVANGNYNNVGTHCFGVTYNVNNTDGSTDITGTLFPSGTPIKGLTGRVGFSSDPTCSTSGLGTINLNIANTTSTTLTTPASSYCEDRSTLEPISGISTEAACTTAGGRWRGYGDSYCENPNTLERLPDYTTESDCTTHSGSWTTPGSPLKYAVYTSTEANAQPVSVGRINTTDIGNTITIYNNFAVTHTETYYYIYIWLDGYLTDNTHTNLPFAANITASVAQNPSATPVEPIRYVYTAHQVPGVSIGNEIAISIATYSTPEGAMASLKTAGGGTTDYPFFFRFRLDDSDIVTESYLGFVITPAMAQANSGIIPGTYYLRGSWLSSTYYEANKEVLLNAFGSSYCTDYSSRYSCDIPGLGVVTYSLG